MELKTHGRLLISKFTNNTEIYVCMHSRVIRKLASHIKHEHGGRLTFAETAIYINIYSYVSLIGVHHCMYVIEYSIWDSINFIIFLFTPSQELARHRTI